eukprot:TRINITY_DN20772_c0_g1_i1.p1 TRINITY_DN20772_c0_g1~~TRINITY_DN20772_c0_g1_i1.p1  ORF type:complete len:338 (-),score=81.69 TRINITY_DN20772_c0_g1_i1:246-1175(-)
MDFLQKCSDLIQGTGLFEGMTESRGNMTFMSKEKIEKKQKKAEKAAYRKKLMELSRQDEQDKAPPSEDAAKTQQEPEGPIPTVATLPLDISFVVPSTPGPDLPEEQAPLCFRAILEDEGLQKLQKVKAEPVSARSQRQPEECPEAQSSSDDEIKASGSVDPESDRHTDTQDGAKTSSEGLMLVCVAGPHGSLPVAVPKRASPGSLVKVRIGPKIAFRAVVPADLKEGDMMALKLPNGDLMQVAVPEGKKSGDEFDISPPVIMVQVPQGGRSGLVVEYDNHEGKKCTTSIPKDVVAGQYFEVPLVQPDFL